MPQEPKFNRWWIPLAAILIHICIGSVYAWSTFNRPIKALFPNDPAWFSPPYTTFTTALVLLGLSAAFGGPWVERRGPRVAATAAAIFFGTGLLIGGLGLVFKISPLVFAGMGVIGGIGCGLGYIAPVSTLVKWFPDRRGMATGMAVMGFGGGAFIAGKLSAELIQRVGVASTIMIMGGIYLCVMLLGALLIRRPPDGWTPEGWTPPAQTNAMVTSVSLTRNEAVRTRQFYLLWGMLFINVTAGIGILAQASPMVQDLFRKTPLEAAALRFHHQPVQCRRTLLLGFAFRLHWPPRDIPDFLHRPDRTVRCHPEDCRAPAMVLVRVRSVRCAFDVWRRLRYHSGFPCRLIRAQKRRGNSWRGVDSVECRCGGRPGDHHGTRQPQ